MTNHYVVQMEEENDVAAILLPPFVVRIRPHSRDEHPPRFVLARLSYYKRLTLDTGKGRVMWVVVAYRDDIRALVEGAQAKALVIRISYDGRVLALQSEAGMSKPGYL